MRMLLALVLLTLNYAQPDSQLHDYLTRLQDFGFTGSVLVVEGDEIILEEGYGVRAETVFGIGSITKVFTGLAVLRLHEQGKLNIDDSLATYFENLPTDKQAITIRQVLQMKAGLAGFHADSDFQPMSIDEAESIILNTPLIDPPGQTYHYSNSGYTLLAILIERVSGQSYIEFVRESILTPLGMKQTGFWGESFEPMAETDNEWNEIGAADEWPHSWAIAGNGGMVSTTQDLYKFMGELRTPTLLPQILFDEFYPNRDGIFVAGGGGGAGYVAVMRYDPASDVTIIGLSSTRAWNIEAILPALLQIAKGETVRFPPQKIEITYLDGYAGTYELANGETLTVQVENGDLYLIPDGQAGVNLLLGKTRDDEFEVLSASATEILQAASEGDLAPFAAALQMPVAEAENLWQDFESNLGAFQSYEILGSAPGELAELATFSQLNFEDGALYMFWSWNGEMIGGISINLAPMPLMNQRYVAVAENEFATFSLQSADTPILKFTAEGLTIGEEILARVE